MHFLHADDVKAAEVFGGAVEIEHVVLRGYATGDIEGGDAKGLGIGDEREISVQRLALGARIRQRTRPCQITARPAPTPLGQRISRPGSSAIQFLGDLVAEEPALHPADGQQIAEALEEAVPDAVFAFAVEAGVVGDGDFRDGEAFHFQQRGDEAVQAAIELELGDAFAA